MRLNPSAPLDSPVYSAVFGCVKRGWSVIPLAGGADASQGKTPDVAWKPYQTTHPTVHELHRWFVERRLAAYGVVCGRLSRLIVLDFDDPQSAVAFIQQFPELARTWIVRSGLRGTPHFYYTVDFHVPCQKVRGGDLKGEGGYVVGAGSEIAGQHWEVACDLPVQHLSREALEQILLFLKPAVYKEETVLVQEPEAIGDPGAVYRQRVVLSGERNNTLFRLAVQLRDQGCSQAWVQQQLVDAHASQFSQDGHTKETYASRQREAQRTIASAFSRPPRSSRSESSSGQLDNSIREALLQREGGAAFLRVYEGLRLKGMPGDQRLTYRDMVTALHGLVGAYSIRKALKMVINGQSLIPRSPDPTPPAAQADPDGKAENKAKTCFVPRQKPTRSPHRPPAYFTLCDPEALRKLLGVKTTASDLLTEAALSSARAYRESLQRAFITRRPGQYPQAWLARRLGVSIRTLYSYHRLEGIVAHECFTQEHLTWENAERLLPQAHAAKRAGVQTQGCFLQDGRGRRYPALLGLARKLLQHGKRLSLCRRTFSRYEVEVETEAQQETRESREEQQFSARLQALDARVQAHFAQAKPEVTAREVQPKSKPVKQSALRPIRPQPTHAEPAAAVDEQIVQNIYKAINACAGEKVISQSSVCQLIEKHGQHTVTRVLRQMRCLHAKGRIANPAGFMVIACRVSART